jgi:hypothetical protein
LKNVNGSILYLIQPVYQGKLHRYSEALWSAPFPLMYGQIVLQFLIYHTPPPFCIGNSATVTIGCYGPQNCGLGYAFYAIVRPHSHRVTAPQKTHPSHSGNTCHTRPHDGLASCWSRALGRATQRYLLYASTCILATILPCSRVLHGHYNDQNDAGAPSNGQ